MGRHGTIANRKSAQDSKRSAMFTKYSRQIIVAAKGGGDPDFNPSLRVAIDKAKAIGMPNDNIKRAIKKGTGELEGESYTELNFEGYGVGGVAVIVEALTDNTNRTTSAVRSTFDKHGGNLGTPGCVSYMFARKGVIVIDNEDEELDEEKVFEDALEAGAADFEADGEVMNVYTAEDDVAAVADALTAAGYKLLSAQVEMIPQNGYIKLTNEDDAKNMQKMLDMFEDNDDVQNVWHNWEDAE